MYKNVPSGIICNSHPQTKQPTFNGRIDNSGLVVQWNGISNENKRTTATLNNLDESQTKYRGGKKRKTLIQHSKSRQK